MGWKGMEKQKIKKSPHKEKIKKGYNKKKEKMGNKKKKIPFNCSPIIQGWSGMD